MSALAKETGAINLSQGFPDFPIDGKLIELVNRHMKGGQNQYAPSAGVFELRERLSDKIRESYSHKYLPEDEITITAGATQAIYTAITAIIREGDEVIVFDPAYDCYVPAIEYNGGIPIHIRMNGPEFRINWSEVKKVVGQRTRMIILNTPHNPSGSVLTAEDMLQLQKITDSTEIIILSDEVYEHLIFDQLEHQSVIRYPKLAARSFVIFSFGKTFHITGWKIGYCVAPGNLTEEFRKAHQFLVFSVNTPIQHALCEYLNDRKNYLQLGEFYQSKRDFFRSNLQSSRFKLLPCRGTYFQTVDYSAISNEPDTEFVKRLTVDHKVAGIPISVFYKKPESNNFIRFCFAKDEDTLKRATDKLNLI